MNITTIYNEAKRGCGFRKEGGMYLMGGTHFQECGRLPLPLDVCPCCGQGIKPSRGWTWVNANELFEMQSCAFDIEDVYDHCEGCLLHEPPEKAGLLWIGEKFYKTPQDFINEGLELGMSRRIRFIPRDFKIGETLVLFAHRKAIKPVNVGIQTIDGEPVGENTAGIFTAMIPTHIEYIVKKDDTEKHLKRLEKQGIKLIKLVRTESGNTGFATDDIPIVDRME